MANIRHYGAGIVITGITDTTPYVLVDLSDTVNFKHGDVNAIILRDIFIEGYTTATDGVWQVLIGVVVENDGTDGTAEWIIGPLLSYHTSGQTVFSNHYSFTHDDEGSSEGLNLKVDTDNDTLKWFLTNNKDADSVSWQNDTNRVSPAGTTTKPGVGDLVMLVTEVGGAANFAGAVTVIYDTE